MPRRFGLYARKPISITLDIETIAVLQLIAKARDMSLSSTIEDLCLVGIKNSKLPVMDGRIK